MYIPNLLTRRSAIGLGLACAADLGLLRKRTLPVSTGVPRPATEEIKSHFPALNRTINGSPLIYFDTAATAQRPIEVIQAIADYYCTDNSNPAANLHSMAAKSYELYERARSTVSNFIHANDPMEIVWTRGTTEGINLVANTWGEANIQSGDEIVLTIAEHASNMLPWQLLAKRKGARIRYADILETGHLDIASLKSQLSERTKLVCFPHVSNVLGIVNPAREICLLAHSTGAKALIDAAQSVPHIPVDVQQLECDFLTFSSHKITGPMGIGVLWIKRPILDGMPPYQSGSNMAHALKLEHWEYADGARKFGAGTPNVADAVGLAAALNFISKVGYGPMWQHEQRLTAYMHSVLTQQRHLRILGSAEVKDRICLFSFVVPTMEPEELARKLDQSGIAIRAGDLAALPLLERFGTKRAARASLYLYNSTEEIESFARKLSSIVKAS